MHKIRSVLRFLNPFRARSGAGPVVDLVALIATVSAVLMALLIPASPTSILPSGPVLPREETALAGTLTEGDAEHLAARSLFGAAVDYPTPGEFLAANGIGFEYVAPGVPHFGYPSGTHGQVSPIVIVLHVAGGSCDGMKSWFKNPGSQASSQFGVCDDGSIDQYVEIEDAAYTQGVVNNPSPYIDVYDGVNPNLLSVSIELEGSCDGTDISQHPRQEATLRLLLGWLRDTLHVPLDRQHVLGHFDIDSVNRPNDPLCLIQDFDAFVATLSPGPGTGAGGAGSPLPLVQIEGLPEVYVAVGGLLIHVCNPDVFEALGYDWQSLRTIKPEDPLAKLSTYRCR